MSIYTIRILHETGADAASKTHHQARQDAPGSGDESGDAGSHKPGVQKKTGRENPGPKAVLNGAPIAGAPVVVVTE